MSLELAIAENTRALNHLIAVLRDQTSNPVPAELKQAAEPEQLLQEDPPKAKRTKKEAAPVEPAGEPVGEPAQEPTAPSPASTATAASETVAVAPATKAPTYADAAAAITRVVKEMGTPTAKALLSAFGASNLKGVPEDRYAEVIAAADATVPF